MDTAGEEEGGKNCQSSIETDTLLPYVKQRASGNLLCATGSSPQCTVTTWGEGRGWKMGGNSKRRGQMCILMADSY